MIIPSNTSGLILFTVPLSVPLIVILENGFHDTEVVLEIGDHEEHCFVSFVYSSDIKSCQIILVWLEDATDLFGVVLLDGTE